MIILTKLAKENGIKKGGLFNLPFVEGEGVQEII